MYVNVFLASPAASPKSKELSWFGSKVNVQRNASAESRPVRNTRVNRKDELFMKSLYKNGLKTLTLKVHCALCINEDTVICWS